MTEFMTAAPPTVSRRLLRRVGGALLVAALSALGVAGGLWLGSPAAAATPPLQVKMAGDVAFSTSASTPLLKVADLVPGGFASGAMEILDDSDSAPGSGWSDTVLLHLVNAQISGNCDLPDASSCHAAGEALRDALLFSVTVTGDGVGHASQQVTAAEFGAGLYLASGLVNGDVITLAVTASLADRAPAADNPMQYGQFGFDLGLSLDRAEPGSSAPSDPTPSDPGPGDEDNQDGEDPGESGTDTPGAGSDETTAVTVAGTQQTAAQGGDSMRGPTSSDKSDDEILVLGDDKSIAYTGLPTVLLLSIGGAALLAGLVLIAAGRRKGARR